MSRTQQAQMEEQEWGRWGQGQQSAIRQRTPIQHGTSDGQQTPGNSTEPNDEQDRDQASTIRSDPERDRESIERPAAREWQSQVQGPQGYTGFRRVDSDAKFRQTEGADSPLDTRHEVSRAEPAEPVEKTEYGNVEQQEQAKAQEEERINTARRLSGRFITEEDDEVPTVKASKVKGRGKGSRRQGTDDEDVEIVMDEDDRRRTRKLQHKQAKKDKLAAKAAKAASPTGTPIRLPDYISVANLAKSLRVRTEDFVVKLGELGFEDVQMDHIINAENAGLIAQEYGFEPVPDRSDTQDLKARPTPTPDEKAALPQRPPVVTIMGHVDHGKTTLLDYLRKSSVAAGEFGGITQHIGAFSVALSSGKNITFLDTPGHAAFLSMRQRGANVTDIVILVVAADDSVKPQTLEAIKHAQAAGVPMIVCINKVDKAEADVRRVRNDLARHGIEVEDYGGDTQVVEVSAKTGKGMEDLEEAVGTLAEMLDHRAEKTGAVEGWVLEASTKDRGKVATILVRRGTLRLGDIIVAGQTFAKVRSLRNEAGVQVNEAGPGTPVEVDGWKGQPSAGDEVLQAPNEQKASSVVDYREAEAERQRLAVDMEAINAARRAVEAQREAEAMAETARAKASETGSEPEQKTKARTSPDAPRQAIVPMILKADVSGSLEAVQAQILALAHPEVAPQIMHSGVGGPTEGDIEHAEAASGVVVSFNASPAPAMRRHAESKGVRVLDNNVIYRLVDEVKALMSEKLAPSVTRRVLADCDIAQVFDIGVGGRRKEKVAGVKVRNGTAHRLGRCRVSRGGLEHIIFDGKFPPPSNFPSRAQTAR